MKLNQKEMEFITKLHCPKCRKEMMADIHENLKKYDNWWCPKCEILLDRGDIE